MDSYKWKYTLVLVSFAYMAICRRFDKDIVPPVVHTGITPAKAPINIMPSPVLRCFLNADLIIAQTGKFYKPTLNISVSSIAVSLLLLMSGVEPNPGPNLNFGLLNVRSAVNKGPLIQDIINSNNLDMLALTETWFSENDPDAVILDLLPSEYNVLHAHRPSATVARGGGLALVFRSMLSVNPPTVKVFYCTSLVKGGG